jgi:hypothetical protein
MSFHDEAVEKSVRSITGELGQTNGLLTILSETITNLSKTLDPILLPESPGPTAAKDEEPYPRSSVYQGVLDYNIRLSELNIRLVDLLHRINL